MKGTISATFCEFIIIFQIKVKQTKMYWLFYSTFGIMISVSPERTNNDQMISNSSYLFSFFLFVFSICFAMRMYY